MGHPGIPQNSSVGLKVIIMFHKAKNVTALQKYTILVHFADGSDKLYDMDTLFEKYPVFKSLETVPGLFKQAKVDVGGYGIVWNEDLDIDSEEIYQNGRDCKTAFTGLIAMSDATVIWNLNESTLRKAISYGKLIPGIDAFNFGSQWVVTAEAMEREYARSHSPTDND